MKKISVIVPVYNVEKYLKESLDSLLSQSFDGMEIILVNDGSTDESGKILQEYKKRDRRIILINKENGGVDTARNAGLDAATGEYIGFLDPDDIAEEALFEKLFENIEKNGSDMAACGYITLLPGGEKYETLLEIKDKKVISTLEERYELINEFLINQKFTGTILWNKLFRRDMIESNKIRFVSHDRIFAEDVFFILEYLFCTDSISALNESLYLYRIRPSSITSTYEEEYFNKIKAYAFSLRDLLYSKAMLEKTRRALAWTAYTHVAMAIKRTKYIPGGFKAKYKKIKSIVGDLSMKQMTEGLEKHRLSKKGHVMYFLYMNNLVLPVFIIVLFFKPQNPEWLGGGRGEKP